MNDNSMLYLVLLGFASGFINMFAGGGSMLVVPFLIFLGFLFYLDIVSLLVGILF